MSLQNEFDESNPVDKSTQTVEEIESDDSSSETSSTDSIAFYDRLPEKEHDDLIQTIFELVHDYVSTQVLKMSNIDFHKELADDITHILFQTLQDVSICKDGDYDDFHAFVSHYCETWFDNGEDPNYPPRNYPHLTDNFHMYQYRLDEDFTKEYIEGKLAAIEKQDAENPKQRTPEWYEKRNNMMTASNLWQTLSSEAQRNRFIYDKCKPTDRIDHKWVSTEGSLHWGVKYEPLTCMVYERLTGAKVGLFGCIQHKDYPFLGASPDGIVINPESEFYGRAVEIKNIYNREMDGVPSEAYWIQIQAQLACCDLDVCDFIETRFKEYATEAEFEAETDPERLRGVILHMVPRDGLSNIPLYQYMPLDVAHADYKKWAESVIVDDYAVYKTIYWYMDDVQMTTVVRNMAWFNAALPILQKTWETIQKERVDGYDHRAPKKRQIGEVIVIKNEESNIIASENT